MYKTKQFAGLIVLVLSQVDGIMKEITGNSVGLYNSNPEKKKINPNKMKYLDEDLYVNFFSNLHQLDVKNRNNYELFKKDIKDLTRFNRHCILHGESFDFDNELNAVKSILLLTFIAEIYSANSD